MKISGARKSRLIFNYGENTQNVKRNRLQPVINYDVIRKLGAPQIFRMDQSAKKPRKRGK